MKNDKLDSRYFSTIKLSTNFFGFVGTHYMYPDFKKHFLCKDAKNQISLT